MQSIYPSHVALRRKIKEVKKRSEEGPQTFFFSCSFHRHSLGHHAALSQRFLFGFVLAESRGCGSSRKPCRFPLFYETKTKGRRRLYMCLCISQWRRRRRKKRTKQRRGLKEEVKGKEGEGRGCSSTRVFDRGNKKGRIPMGDSFSPPKRLPPSLSCSCISVHLELCVASCVHVGYGCLLCHLAGEECLKEGRKVLFSLVFSGRKTKISCFLVENKRKDRKW